MKQPLEIDIHSVRQMRESNEEFLLIDCREPNEHEICRLEGSALIPMGQTLEQLGQLSEHKDKPIVVY